MISGPLMAACGSSSSGGSSDSGVITSLATVPVGGGVILLDAKKSVGEPLVVTQPTAGTVKAFSAVCTHLSCPVAQIKGQIISCNCHGSEFSLADGSVVKGPATQPLKEIAVKVDGANVVKA